MVLDQAVEGLLRRDRLVVVAMLALVAAAGWVYLLAGAGMDMGAMEPVSADAARQGDAVAPAAWTPGYAIVVFVMWWIMMIAMMLPGATPVILLFAAINRRQRQQHNPYVPTTLFTASYLLAWAGFSLAATVLHGALERAGLLSSAMTVSSDVLAGGALLAAGLYQFTPLKRACLRHCRLPAHQLARYWRPGARGALAMGMRHGTYCLGCCWFLMLLLFVGGVMNLVWIAALAAYVLLEKSVPAGSWLDRGLAIILLGAGGALLLS